MFIDTYQNEKENQKRKPVQIGDRTTTQNLFDSFKGLFEFVISSFAFAFEPFLRDRFGERYFTFFKFLIGLSFLIAITAGSSQSTDFLPLQSQFSPSAELPNFSFWLFVGYTVFYVVFSFVEFRGRFNARIRGDIWHSQSVGESRFTFLHRYAEELGIYEYLGKHPVKDYIVQLYLEPFFCVGLGLCLLPFTPLFSAWLVGGGILVFIRMQFLYNRYATQFLDQADSKIEAEFVKDAVKNDGHGYKKKGFDGLAIRPQGVNFTPSTDEILREVMRENKNFTGEQKKWKTNQVLPLNPTGRKQISRPTS